MNGANSNHDQDRAWRTAMSALRIASGLQNAPGSGKQVTNSAAIVAANPIFAPSIADFGAALPKPPSGKFLADGAVFFRGAAVDTAFVCEVVQDPGAAQTVVGPSMTVDSSHVNANGYFAIPPFSFAPGAGVRVYAIRISSAATNAQVLAANEAFIRVVPDPQGAP